ncbi:MAG: transporter substrate-binding domain-containing protein [Lachnospiraceae bacterium]|nr:transporter substrate-binding domain-containing protein [Lachnospiraceae bacterium]
MKKKRQYRKAIIYGAILCCVGVLSLYSLRVNAEETQTETVRVGYYPVANYQEKTQDGMYKGFSYDYFMQIQKYTRWNYEFVEASYADCMKMLMTGEIDMMSGVSRNADREKQMIFSDSSVSNSQNKFYARNDNDQLFYESYDTFDGCRIAMMKGTLTDEVDTYCKKHDFQLDIRFYDAMDEMQDALHNGEVDMVCAASIGNEEDTKIVARMNKQPLYYVTSMAKPELAEELDAALHNIVDNNPDFYTQMGEKYRISGANATATFTREELEYIRSGKDVYIIINPDWAPITWYDEESKSYKGIFIDVIHRIEEYSGMKFILCTEDEFNEIAAKDPEIINDVIAILADDNSWAVQQNVMLSNHVADSSVVMVAKQQMHQKNYRQDAQRIALPHRFYIGYTMRDVLKDKDVVYYDTVEDCLNAVNNGKADCTYVNELVATYYLSMLTYSDLFATANSGYYENLTFAVNKDSPAPLLSIMDKSLLCIGSTELEQIIIQNSIAEERFSIRGFYYNNPMRAIAIVVFAVLLALSALLSIYYVMSKRKKVEQELQREFEINAARTEFFMMISHELRTPLNAIVGYLNRVSEEHEANGWEMEYVRRCRNAAKQLTDISEDMLDYTRISSGNVAMREELFDLKEVILNVDQNISLKAEEKNLNYRIVLQDMSHEYVIGDRLRVTQIFQNLLSNGVKFTDPGGTVEGRVEEKVQEDGGVLLTFTCRDNGKGMSEEFLQKVCAPFNQSDASYSRTHGGLGLGLYLTKYFVNAMKGTFRVESKLNEGSTFTVTIPLMRPHSEQILDRDIDCAHVRAIAGGANGDENTRLKDLLKRLHMKCDTVGDGEKLCKRIRSRMGGDYQYGLCIIDETLLIDGTDIIKQIASLENPPVIFAITSNSRQIDRLSEMRQVTQVLYKPIFQSVLFDAVMNTFGAYTVENTPKVQEDFQGLHAMIVEDNMVNADILTGVLRKANVEVSVFDNGQLAVEEFERAPEGTYQIIFMDIQMPVMNGYDATLRIRHSQCIWGASIPIVAVSANAFPEDKEKSIQVGMNEHMSKPICGEKLCGAIHKYCAEYLKRTKVS